jgi:hypothetical protein
VLPQRKVKKENGTFSYRSAANKQFGGIDY